MVNGTETTVLLVAHTRAMVIGSCWHKHMPEAVICRYDALLEGCELLSLESEPEDEPEGLSGPEAASSEGGLLRDARLAESSGHLKIQAFK